MFDSIRDERFKGEEVWIAACSIITALAVELVIGFGLGKETLAPRL